MENAEEGFGAILGDPLETDTPILPLPLGPPAVGTISGDESQSKPPGK